MFLSFMGHLQHYVASAFEVTEDDTTRLAWPIEVMKNKGLKHVMVLQ